MLNKKCKIQIIIMDCESHHERLYQDAPEKSYSEIFGILLLIK
jgi:hypothetical protein